MDLDQIAQGDGRAINGDNRLGSLRGHRQRSEQKVARPATANGKTIQNPSGCKKDLQFIMGRDQSQCRSHEITRLW